MNTVIGIAGAALLALAASGAGAQLVGGGAHVGSAVGGTVGGLGAGANVGAHATGAVDARPAVGAATGVVGDTAGAAHATTRAATDTARDAAAATSGPARATTRTAASGKVVQVQVGARTQVDRETTCYDGTDYYDPYYADGYYYCETRTTGPGAAVGVKVGG